MCTLGAISGSYLFKTRDLWSDSDPTEEIVSGHGRYRYIGVQGHASPLERGLNSGINEKGVAVAVTFVDAVPLAEALAAKTPRGVLVEEILRSCSDLSAALRIVTEFLTAPLVGGNIVIATPEGGFVVEQLYPCFAIEFITEPVTVRTNHFLNLRTNVVLQGDRNNFVSRFNRMHTLLDGVAAVGLETVQAALADHQSPHPVCSHAGELRTVSAAIYDLRSAAMHYAAGPPCSALWKRHKAG
jgi:Acyl-coenzyme A:6-aminopenicillanic acid acyl-transferase